ncbi:hypothetical protein PAXRUDRAFT_20640 [Paxillus rubicundulus Ve08.2h10]|uniref:Uncharacterized protein n=1 Tax=Paxillus rubicundulus Ve08.2h10 TaxID=930991 RepID=A0A0D0D1B5_9AGAM|nr:hypothetical protein PAXRUDRAFT_20640 [Paxillus rubicundulus Ve08.2h10]
MPAAAVEFMLALLQHLLDLYLDKIQEQLLTLHQVSISLSTIWQTLKQLGLSSKQNVVTKPGRHSQWPLVMKPQIVSCVLMRVLSTS